MPSGRTKISPKSGRGLGHVTSTIFGSTVGYPSDSLASCSLYYHAVVSKDASRALPKPAHSMHRRYSPLRHDAERSG